MNPSMRQQHIKYPCDWLYTVIGTDEVLIRNAIGECIDCCKDYTISFSKKSATGKYISMSVSTKVSDEGERDRIYSSLCKHSAVKMVL